MNPSSYQIRLFAWIVKRRLAGARTDDELTRPLPPELQKIVRKINSDSDKRLKLLCDNFDPIDDGQRDALAISIFNARQTEQPPNTSLTLEDVAAIIRGVEWLWEGWIPYGMVTLLIAEPGVGKSAFVLGGLVPAITMGHAFPDGQPGFADPGSVISCDTEAAHAMTVERAAAWGIPADRLLLPGDNPLESISIDNRDQLDQLRAQIVREKAPLLVIDSLRSAHGGEENSSHVVGPLMKSLALIAQSTNCAVLVVHHTRKIGEGQSVGHNSARGSNAVVAIARSVIALSRPDPGDDRIRVEVVKSNVGKKPDPLGFTIDEEGISFCDPPREAHNSGPPTQLERAKTFLSEFLAEGPQVKRAVEQAAKDQGISDKTLTRAKGILGILSTKRKDHWSWSLPPRL